MQGCIFYYTKDRGKDILTKIEEGYLKMGIPILQKRFDSILFKNTDFWELISGNITCRGKRCNIAYIDKNIPNSCIEQIIMPMITLPPYQAIHYF